MMQPYPKPKVGMVDSGASGIAGGANVGASARPAGIMPGEWEMAGGGWQAMLMSALQNPMIQQLLQAQQGQQQPQMMQPPGLLMPQVQAMPFQVSPLTGLFGGLNGRG